MMRLLIGAGAQIDLPTRDNTTPLMLAAGLSQIEGPQGRRADASRPWYYSGWNERSGLEAVKLLVELGANVNAASQAAFNAEARLAGTDFPAGAGHTPLHGAAYIGANQVVRFLVEHGATLDVQDKLGQTPYRVAEGHTSAGAAFYRRPETAALLRSLGANTSLGVDAHSQVRAGARDQAEKGQ
jgi:ankyrin repeat protein